MQKFKVSTRLAISFGLVLALMLLISAIGAWQINKAQEQSAFLKTRQATTALIMEWAHLVDVNATQALALIHAADEATRTGLRNQLNAGNARIAQVQEEFGQLIFLAEGKAIYQQIQQRRNAYMQVRDRAFQTMDAGRPDSARQLLETELAPLTAAYLNEIQGFISFQNNYVDRLFSESHQSAQLGLIILAIATVLALILGPLFAAMMARGLLRQLGGEPAYAAEIANQIAAGKLDVHIQTRQNDHSSLLASMEKMRANLARMVGEIRQGASAIASASAQIASGNLDLSSRTEQQASSLAQTAATMEEITATVRQNTDNAHQANSLAEAAATTASSGGELMSELIGTMGEINTKSQQVSDIIGVIDGIAFQTNILALNAAVEAARAGEQGRGFAVVASEVRALAQRSAASAREIKGLIEASVQATSKGNEQAAHAGTTMQEIVSSIHRVTDIMSEITAASQEQTSGIEQINTAVAEMDDVTRQNASLVEESAAAAGSLEDQANNLGSLIAAFRLGDDHSSPAAPRKVKSIRVDAPAQLPAQTAQAALAHNGLRRPLPAAKRAKPGTPALPGATPQTEEWLEF